MTETLFPFMPVRKNFLFFHQPVLLLIVALLLTGFSGCSNAHSGEETDQEKVHITPVHKPDNFANAVKNLIARQQQYASANAQQKQELRDILEWLPELAAQTDLPKADWDRINQLSQQLIRNFDTAEKSAPSWAVAAELEELQRLAQSAENLRITPAPARQETEQ